MVQRAVKAKELFSTFNYDGKDCADMGIYNITNGSVYTMNTVPTFSDKTLEVPSYDGKYYYDTQITGQQFVFNCFAHDLSALEYNRMRSWLNPRKIGRLILSDQTYKYYLVKPVSVSTLADIPLMSIQTPSNSILGDYASGDVVYTGNFSITFETVGSAYGYGRGYYRDDLIYDAATKYGRDYYYDAGLLYKDMSPRLKWTIAANSNDTLQEGADKNEMNGYEIPMYNPGDSNGQPVYTLTWKVDPGDNGLAEGSLIQITNKNTGGSTIIDVSGVKGRTITIDSVGQVLTDKDGNKYYGRFIGDALQIEPYESVIELPETFVLDIDNTDLIEYNTFTLENNVVSINPNILKVSDEFIGRYFCVNFNGGCKIKDVDSINNTLTLAHTEKYFTYDIPAGETNVEPSGFKFNYIEVYDVLPSSGNLGDVCVVNNTWYVYLYGEWTITTLFSSKEQFKNIYGDYITQYRMFGATIVALDDVTIKTGTYVGSAINKIGQKIQAISVPEFTLEAELLPRYL